MARNNARFIVDEKGQVTDLSFQKSFERVRIETALNKMDKEGWDQILRKSDYKNGKSALKLSGLIGGSGVFLLGTTQNPLLVALGVILLLLGVFTWIAGAKMFWRGEP